MLNLGDSRENRREDKAMKIGVIGPKISCDKIHKDLSEISPETEVKLYIREKSADAIQVIERCEHECDAILFTGIGPYTGASDGHEIALPHTSISKGLSSLSRAFLDMQKAGFPLDRFSTDVIAHNTMEDAFYEMDISPNEIYLYPFKSYEEMDYVDWHLSLWKQKKTAVILTGFVWVYDYLKAAGYPVFYLSTMRCEVRDALARLESLCALNEARYSRISVEILKITVASENSENYYSNMIQKSRAESFIIEYAQHLQASFFNDGRNEYIIFANKGYTMSEENYQLLRELQGKVASVGFHLNIGIGNALTAYQSETNARKALQHSRQSKDNYTYMVDENDNLYGPLGEEQSLEYELVSTDENMLRIAEKCGMSAGSVAKIQSIINVRKSNVFDVEQLADCLKMTPRSARRVAAKLMEAGFASVCAKESKAGAGRPKSLFEVNF